MCALGENWTREVDFSRHEARTYIHILRSIPGVNSLPSSPGPLPHARFRSAILVTHYTLLLVISVHITAAGVGSSINYDPFSEWALAAAKGFGHQPEISWIMKLNDDIFYVRFFLRVAQGKTDSRLHHDIPHTAAVQGTNISTAVFCRSLGELSHLKSDGSMKRRYNMTPCATCDRKTGEEKT